MKTGHLNDGQLQEILDNMVLGSDQSLDPHLMTCSPCRERFEQYRRLYAGLAVDPGFVLPPKFADSIIKKLPASLPVFWARPAVKIFLAAGACALVAAVVLIFVDMKPLIDSVLRVFKTMASAFQSLSVQFQQLLPRLHGSARLFILGGLGLLSAAFFDHILRQTLRHSR